MPAVGCLENKAIIGYSGVTWGSALVGTAGGRVGFSEETSGKTPMCRQERLLMGAGNRIKLSPF